MRYRFFTADVFTDRPFGGNPLAVFPEAEGLGDAVMQKIAKEFNLSETVFVLPPEASDHTRKLRIFTPGREVPFAGHPTVGSAFVLAACGLLSLEGDETRIIFEEGVGPVPVLIRSQGGEPVFSQLSAAQMPEFGPPPPSGEDLAAALSLDPGDLDPDFGPQAVSCGLPFLCVPLRSREALARARPRTDEWDRVIASFWADLAYLFVPEPGGTLRARMFGPGYDVPEDPATGSAATALAGWLAHRDERPEGSFRWTIEQGIEMGRPSRIEAEADKVGGSVVGVRVGGPSVLMCEGWIDVAER